MQLRIGIDLYYITVRFWAIAGASYFEVRTRIIIIVGARVKPLWFIVDIS